jgi:hypothetical protein
VACSHFTLHPLFIVVLTSRRLRTPTAVSCVCYVSFSVRKAILQAFFFGNLSVRVSPTRERTICLNDVFSLNIQTNLVTDTRALEFVRIPFRVEWTRFVNPKIGAIDRCFAHTAIVVQKAVLPIDLNQG